jgi:hypothetical protein
MIMIESPYTRLLVLCFVTVSTIGIVHAMHDPVNGKEVPHTEERTVDQVDKSTPEFNPPSLVGDADQNGRITAHDAEFVNQVYLDMADKPDGACIDVNQDGDVTPADASLIQEYVNGDTTNTRVGEPCDNEDKPPDDANETGTTSCNVDSDAMNCGQVTADGHAIIATLSYEGDGQIDFDQATATSNFVDTYDCQTLIVDMPGASKTYRVACQPDGPAPTAIPSFIEGKARFKETMSDGDTVSSRTITADFATGEREDNTPSEDTCNLGGDLKCSNPDLMIGGELTEQQYSDDELAVTLRNPSQETMTVTALNLTGGSNEIEWDQERDLVLEPSETTTVSWPAPGQSLSEVLDYPISPGDQVQVELVAEAYTTSVGPPYSAQYEGTIRTVARTHQDVVPSRDRRVAFWCGKVNVHREDGEWVTDPDGVSGCPSRSAYADSRLTYCQKFWPDTESVDPAGEERITTWRDRGNRGRHAATKMTYRCVGDDVDNDGLIADFTVSPSNPTSKSTVRFTYSGDDRERIESYQWVIEDRVNTTSQWPRHVAKTLDAGDHEVTLTVTAKDGEQASHTERFTVDQVDQERPVEPRVRVQHHSPVEAGDKPRVSWRLPNQQSNAERRITLRWDGKRHVLQSDGALDGTKGPGVQNSVIVTIPDSAVPETEKEEALIEVSAHRNGVASQQDRWRSDTFTLLPSGSDENETRPGENETESVTFFTPGDTEPGGDVRITWDVPDEYEDSLREVHLNVDQGSYTLVKDMHTLRHGAPGEVGGANVTIPTSISPGTYELVLGTQPWSTGPTWSTDINIGENSSRSGTASFTLNWTVQGVNFTRSVSIGTGESVDVANATVTLSAVNEDRVVIETAVDQEIISVGETGIVQSEQIDFTTRVSSINKADDKEGCPQCTYKGSCVPIGTRVDNGTSRYCGIDKSFHAQKPTGSSCQNDYECTTNTCSSGECVDLQEDLEEQQSLLIRIASFLGMA